MISMALIAVCAGWAVMSVRSDAQVIHSGGEEYILRGIVEEARDLEASVAFVMNVESVSSASAETTSEAVTVPFRIAGTIPGFSIICRPADTLVIRLGVIPLPRPDYVPAISEYDGYLLRRGVTARAVAVVVDTVLAASGARLPLRERLADKVAGSALSEKSAAIVSALVLGVNSLLSSEMRATFRESGLAHIFALSGLHVGIVLLIATIVLLPLRLLGRPRLYRSLILLLLWAYAAFTGMSVSVFRASIMATVVLCARMLARRYSPVNALAVAAVVILAVEPEELFGPGFQLSFAAVLSLLIFAEPIGLFRNYRRLSWLGHTLSATLAAAVGTLAITVYWFGAVPVYFLIANMAVLWIMPLVVGISVVFCAFLAVGLEISWLTDSVEFLCEAVDSVGRFIASLPGARLTLFCSGSIWFVAVYVVALCLVVWAWKRHKKVTSACIVALAIATVVVMESFVYVGRHSQAYVIDAHGTPQLLVHDRHRCLLLVSGDESVKNAGWRRYDAFLNSIGMDSLTVYNASCACVGERSVFMVDALYSLKACKCDYALVGNAYGASPHHVIDSLRPDTVVLSAEIGAAMRDRWFACCDSAGVGVIDLRCRGAYFIF